MVVPHEDCEHERCSSAPARVNAGRDAGAVRALVH
uniref:Uncharacterized protein n=1 Tax=Arundo donax TaxID=35708 RepID=A0A0A8YZF0_ARUDO